jgi:hypothetical protein
MSGAYRQIRLQPLTVRLSGWIFLSFHDMKTNLFLVADHPMLIEPQDEQH